MKQRLLLTLLVLSLTVVAKAQGNTAPAVKDGISYHINYDKKTAKVIAPINFNGEKKEYIGNIVIPETIRFTAEDATVLNESMTGYVQFGTDYTVTEISTEAFKNDVTTGVEIPGTIDEIPDFCFTYCPNLRNVIIHYGVQRVGKYAFCGIQKLGETNYLGGLKNLESVIFNSTVTFLTNGKGNCVIDDCAFSECENLKNLELRCVTSIGFYAFSSCNSLTQLTLPESLNTIGKRAFKETKIKSLIIPSSLTSIGEEAFAFTDLMSIEVDARNTKYDSRENCNAIIETANNSLILGCGNTIIPNSVTSLGYCAFFGCLGLTSITIPNSVTSIENAAFFGCWNLESVNIPNTITTIGDNTFEGCMSLSAINIPSSITNIGMFAFNDCRSLTNVIIPNSVTSIGKYAFNECTNLKEIYCLSETPPTLGEYALPDGLQITTATPSLKEENGCIVYVPIGCREAYAEAWNIPTSRIVEIEVTAIEKTQTTPTEVHPIGYYNLQGQRINKPQSGIVIVRYSDGTNRKILVK